MSPLAVGLILVSCVLHASWNLLLKRAGDKLAFTAVFLLLSPVLFLPVFAALFGEARIPPAGWACIIATGAAYATYFIALAIAYEGADLSLAYPLSRGIGPMLTLLWGVLLLGERPTLLGVVGVCLILGAAGVLLWPAGGQTKGRTLSRPILAAMGVGLTSSVYSLLEKVTVGTLRVDPILYPYLAYAIAGLLVARWVARRKGAGALWLEWERARGACVGVAFLSLFTGILVMYALRLPRAPVSYIVPLRSASVVIAVILGVDVLGEGRRWAKLGAAALTLAGIALMAWRG